MKRPVIALFAALCLSGPIVAQVMGLGSGLNSGGLPNIYTHDVSKGILYTDNIRAAVTNVNTSTPPGGIPQYDLTVPSANGFQVGDMVLIVQMKDAISSAPTGNHQNAIIDAIVGNVISTHALSATPVVNFYALPGSSNRVQVIKIDQYTDFTINSGEVSCHPWDESTGTGGVLCFLVKNKLAINGGIFNVAGKGYTPSEVAWGMGGAGAAGAVSVSGIGHTAPIAAIGCTSRTALTGSAGGAANNPGGGGSLNSWIAPQFITPQRIKNTKAVMGTAGYYRFTYGGGTGAGGGGKGGTGATTCLLSGDQGGDGTNGEKGGDPGHGAAGGGIIIIKAHDISVVSTTTVYFTTKGQDGDNGRNGGNGGVGGYGGNGGAGSCWVNGQFCDPGGPGGKGESGMPGNGGDGGNGAGPGTVWVFAEHMTAGFTSIKAIDVGGGAGGQGGPGGYSWTDFTPLPLLDDPCAPSCPVNPGGPGGGSGGGPCTNPVIKRACDRFGAFCRLSLATASALHNPGANSINNGYDFTDNSGTLTAIYDIDRHELVGIEYDLLNCIEIHHIATLYSTNDCDLLFKKIAYMATGQTSVTNQVINLSSIDDGGTCGNFGSLPRIVFKDTSGNDMFLYDGGLDYIEDLSEPGHPRCYTGPCTPVIPIATGTPGRDGELAPPGSTELGDMHANGVIDILNPFWKPLGIDEVSSTTGGLALYPNPVTHMLHIEVSPAPKDIIEITDIAGKAMYKEHMTSGSLSVDVARWSAGIYIVKHYSDEVLLHTSKMVKVE